MTTMHCQKGKKETKEQFVGRVRMRHHTTAVRSQ